MKFVHRQAKIKYHLHFNNWNTPKRTIFDNIHPYLAYLLRSSVKKSVEKKWATGVLKIQHRKIINDPQTGLKQSDMNITLHTLHTYFIRP